MRLGLLIHAAVIISCAMVSVSACVKQPQPPAPARQTPAPPATETSTSYDCTVNYQWGDSSDAYSDPIDAFAAFGEDGYTAGVTNEMTKAFIDRYRSGEMPAYELPNGTKVAIVERGVNGHAKLLKVSIQPGQKVKMRTPVPGDTEGRNREEVVQVTTLILYMFSDDITT